MGMVHGSEVLGKKVLEETETADVFVDKLGIFKVFLWFLQDFTKDILRHGSKIKLLEDGRQNKD